MRALLAMIGGMVFLAVLLGGTGRGLPSPVAAPGPSIGSTDNLGGPPAPVAPPTVDENGNALVRSSELGPVAPIVVQQDPPPEKPHLPPEMLAQSQAPAVSAWGSSDSDDGDAAQTAGTTAATAQQQTPAAGGWGAPMMDPKPSR